MPGQPARSSMTLRGLLLAIAAVAGSMAWSGHWSDCKHRAVFHAVAASEARSRAGTGGMDGPATDRQIREVRWHEEMSRRFERAAWCPWPFPPAEPPRPD